MPNIQVKIENLAEIKAAFKKSPTLMTKHLNDAIRKTLFNIRTNEFKEYRALGINIITGGLYSSIERGIYSSNLKGEVGPNVSSSAGVDYAIYVHDGTTRMKARPFLLNAVDDSNTDTQDYFKKAVQDTLDDIARETKI